MPAVGTRGSGRPRLVPPIEQIEDKLRDGMTLQEIADEAGVSKSAINMAVRRAKQDREALVETALPKFPWVVRTEHTQDMIYKYMTAYRRHAAGLPVSAEQLRMADKLRSITARLGVAVTYDYERGFSYTNRLPADGEAMFVVREGAAKAPTGSR